MIIWIVLVGIMLGLEVFAILTKEKYIPTLSRTIWRLLRLEDASYDDGEIVVRSIFTLVLVVLFAWLVIHLAWGPCALGVCSNTDIQAHPTYTPKPTHTPKATHTPRNTYTPDPTYTPWNTFTPCPVTETPLPTATEYPTQTEYPTATYYPTSTPWPTQTNYPDQYCDVSATYTPTPDTEAFYVSTSGNDSNPGTFALPWKTVQKAVNTISAGQIAYIRGGTYNEAVYLSRSGTALSYLRIAAYPSENPIINGGSSLALRASSNIAYWEIDGLSFQSTARYTIQLGWWSSQTVHDIVFQYNVADGPVVFRGYNIFVYSNLVDGTGYSGSYGDAGLMDIQDSHHITYMSNTVRNMLNYNARGIWTQGTTHDHLIENNIVENITPSGLGQCIDLDGAGNVEYNHVVRGNTVNGCSYVGIQLENVFNSLVEDNIVIDGGSSGITLINYDSGVGCGYAGGWGDSNGDDDCKGDPTQNIIRNNTITDSGGWGWGYGGIIVWGAGAITFDGNYIQAAYGGGNAGINFQGDAGDSDGNVLINNEIDLNDTLSVCVRSWTGNTFVEDDWNTFHRANSQIVYGTGSNCAGLYTLPQYRDTFNMGLNSVYLSD